MGHELEVKCRKKNLDFQPKKPKKKKKSKKSDCVVKFTSMKKADTKLLLVRQKPHKVDKKHHSFLIPCDDCEANLLPLDMKIHHKRFHLEVPWSWQCLLAVLVDSVKG